MLSPFACHSEPFAGCHSEPFTRCHPERSEESLAFRAQGKLREAHLVGVENNGEGFFAPLRMTNRSRIFTPWLGHG